MQGLPTNPLNPLRILREFHRLAEVKSRKKADSCVVVWHRIYHMSEQTNNVGIGFGVFLAVVGLLLLCFRIFWDFCYRLLGRLLHAENSQVYPSKAYYSHLTGWINF
jgi:hypothetical protein